MTTIPIFVLAGQSNADKSGIDNRIIERLVAQGNAFEFVKTSESSTSIYPNANRDDWDPGTKELFTQLVTAVKAAMTNVTRQGDIPQINILWVQGENDANSPTQSYYDALTNFITQLRTQIGDFSAKFYISTLPYASNVRDAQYEVAADMSNVYTIDTTGAGFWDGIHYDKPTVEWIADAFMDMTGIAVQTIAKYKNTLAGALFDTTNGHPVVTSPRYQDYTFVGSDTRGYMFRSRSGDDNVTTGDGNDTIYTGGNYDTVHAGGGNDFVSLEDHADIGYGGDGNDTIWGGPGNDTIYGEAGNDSLTGDTENDIVSGGLGNDTLLGGDGNDTLYGDDGNDSLSGGYGADILDGGNGDDYLTAFHDNDILTGGAGNDTLYGGGENDTLHGGDGNDLLSGDTENDYLAGDGGLDTLYGGAGDDTLIGNGGDAGTPDLMFGGSGNDIYYVYGTGDIVSESSIPGIDDGGNDTVVASIDYTLPDFIENLVLTAAATGSGNGLDNILTATFAGSTLYGQGGDDTLVAVGQSSLDGGAGNDHMVYSGNDNTVTGGDGDDVFTVPATSSSGNVLDGGDGFDTLDLSMTQQGVTVDLAAQTLSTGETINHMEGVIGSTFSDLLSGDTGVALYGAAGNDTLSSTGGNNLLDGGAGDDLIAFAGSGNTVSGGDGDDHLIVLSIGGNSLDGGDGSDTADFSQLAATVTVDLATGSAFADGGSDSLVSIETVIGSSGADRLSGDDLANLLIGGGGDDTLVGNGGNDTLDGLAGNDLLYGDNGLDWLDGGVGNDSLYGGNDADTLSGGDGNDSLDGGAGADLMTGGAGNDTFIVDSAGDVVSELAGGGTDIVKAGVSYTLSDNVENLTLTGTGNFNGTGNALANILTGNTGNNLLIAGEGNDTLDGGVGADTLNGGNGNDTYLVDNSADVIVELSGQGTDIVKAWASFALSDNIETLLLQGTDNIAGTGNALANTLTGNSGNNALNGGDGNDTLDGGLGNDTLIGGAGNDVYYVDAIGDVVNEAANQGTDLVRAYLSYALGDNVENLSLLGATDLNGTGNALNNVLSGTTGANTLIGLAGNDTLGGLDGNDILIGGMGDDSLDGGNGADTYVFAAAGVANGVDKVANFVHGQDVLLFSGADYGVEAGHVPTSAEFTSGTTAVGTHAQFIFNAVTHTLYWDHDGAGGDAAVAIAVFNASIVFTPSDMHFA